MREVWTLNHQLEESDPLTRGTHLVLGVGEKQTYIVLGHWYFEVTANKALLSMVSKKMKKTEIISMIQNFKFKNFRHSKFFFSLNTVVLIMIISVKIRLSFQVLMGYVLSSFLGLLSWNLSESSNCT